MAREILFKAKRIDNGEWVEGSIITRKDTKRVFMVDIENITALRSVTTNYCDRYDWRAVEVQADTICQYTGLTDKNGNKIWENDVVEVWWKQRTLETVCEPPKYKAIIEFGNPNSLYSWGYQLRFLEDFPFNNDILLWIDMEETGAYCEAIGNKFDNPELLGGAE